MITLHFGPSEKRCPDCGARLKAYKTRSRRVKSTELGVFHTKERIRRCSNGHPRKLFRSQELSQLVGKGCVYAHDVLLEAGKLRFLEGRSCREIAQQSGTGISERHARRLSSTALSVLKKVHEEHAPALTAAMGRWVLQIDGMVDGEYEMIVAVRDAVSGFLLYGKRCHFEKHAEIVPLLREVRERYGVPCAAICDLRAGILSALGEVFPGVPVAVCRYHFLRDLGKDLMESDHVRLGKVLTTYGIRTALKRVLRTLPDYQVALLREVESGYCSDPKRLAVMECRRELESILSTGDKSGLGFPFTLRHLSFVKACGKALQFLVENNAVAQDEGIEEAVCAIQEVVRDPQVLEVQDRLKEVEDLFESLRVAMYPKPVGTPLSGEPARTSEATQSQCRTVMGELEKALTVLTPGHVSWAAKKIMMDYRKWEARLFPTELPGVKMPGTNNGLEQVFRRVRRNVRKRCGDKATGRQLTLAGERLLLYQNLINPTYVKAVFGEEGMAKVFGRERALLPKVLRMGKKERERLLDRGQALLKGGTIPRTPYGEEVFAEARQQRLPLAPSGIPPPGWMQI